MADSGKSNGGINYDTAEGKAYLAAQTEKLKAEAAKIAAETRAVEKETSKEEDKPSKWEWLKDIAKDILPAAITAGIGMFAIRYKKKQQDEYLGTVLAVENTGRLPADSGKILKDSFESTAKEIERLRS